MNRSIYQYSRVFRSVEHKQLRELCESVRKSPLPAKYQSHAPAIGFEKNIISFARAILELYEKRQAADYDILTFFNGTDVVQSIKMAREGLEKFETATADQRECFPGLLLFPLRR